MKINQSIAVVTLLRHIHNIEHLRVNPQDLMWSPMQLPMGEYAIKFGYAYTAPSILQYHKLLPSTTLMDVLLIAAQMFEDVYGAIDSKTKHCVATEPMMLPGLELFIRDFSFPVSSRGPGFVTTPFFETVTIDKDNRVIDIAMGN